MFKASDIKIAVSNAIYEVKKVANKIILSNVEDAVAKYLLENTILEEK